MDKSGEKPKKERKTRKKKSPQNKTKKIYKSGPRLNEKIIEMLSKLAKLMQNKGKYIKTSAYSKAKNSIMAFQENISDLDQLDEIPNVGPAIKEKAAIYIETNTLPLFEEEKQNPIHILTEVHGIGPVKAKELIEKHNITTIEQLRTKEELLNDVQKKGLKYYEDLIKRIPRDEIDKYNIEINGVFEKVKTVDARFEIVGSYRRGLKESGDIDVILTAKDPSFFRSFISELKTKNIILEVLSEGDTKSFVIAKLPYYKTARRVDFMYTPPEEFPFAILYFTGSKEFNTSMRAYALKLGVSLNEHGLSKKAGKKKDEEKLKVDVKTEEDIFKKLHLKYVEPVNRINGNNVISTIPTIIHKAEPKDSECFTSCETVPSGSCGTGCEPSWTSNKQKDSRNWCTCNLEEKDCGTKICPVHGSKTNKSNETRKQIPKRTNKRITLKKIDIKSLDTPSLENKKQVHFDKILEKKSPLEEKMDKKQLDFKERIELFKKTGLEVLEKYNENELNEMLEQANIYYYNKQPLMSDNQFDIIKEYVERKYPKNEIINKIGAPISGKNKVELPYFMGSMDKIKPDTNALTKWKAKYDGPYVLSAKLDGISGLYSTENGVEKLYTRGNGAVGQDISMFIPYLKLPKLNEAKDVTLRGELIIDRNVFEQKYKNNFANPRNFVAGIMNSKNVDTSKIADIHFVAYEVIKPELKPSEQMKMLETLNIYTVLNETHKDITNEMLSQLLMKVRSTYKYESDGIIVANDKSYQRQNKNPEHAFAFKMVISDQIAEAKVIDVIWSPSKSGFLKPRVRIEPIQLGGVKIEYATGFNGSFIENNKIGIGAKIQLIRSGDVIPYIREVIEPADAPKMPNVGYHWNETHIDIILDDADSDITVREKNITEFFKGLGIKDLGPGNVKRIMDTGFDTLPKIILMKKYEFAKVEGFKEKMVDKIYNGIKDKVKSASLIDIMSASNMFGRGIGKKKITPIMEMYPNILTSDETDEEKIEMLKQVPNIGKENAQSFVKNIPVFLKFMQEAQIQEIQAKKTPPPKETKQIVQNILTNKKVVMTKVRDKEIIAKIEASGGKLADAVNKETFALVVKSYDDDSNKVKKAKELGVSIMTPEDFKKKYM